MTKLCKCSVCGFMNDKTFICKKCGRIVCIYCAEEDDGLCVDCLNMKIIKSYNDITMIENYDLKAV